MGQGRVPPAQQVFFGSAYAVRMDYTGAQDITVGDKPAVTDHVMVSVKGPKADFSFEIFFARDAARTPLADPDSADAWGRSRWSWCAEMRVAFFSPLPPARSGIADYSEALIESPAAAGGAGSLLRRRTSPSTRRASISRSTRWATTATTISSTRRRCGIPAWW